MAAVDAEKLKMILEKRTKELKAEDAKNELAEIKKTLDEVKKLEKEAVEVEE